MIGQDVGIDLGTATVLVYVKGKGIVLKEPSVVAIDKNNNKVLAVGEEARRMVGRTPNNIVAIRPLRDGVISDYETTEKMIKYFLNKVIKSSFFKPRVIICVPSGVTEVEEMAVEEAARNAGAKYVGLIEEPKAAAIGAGIDIVKPNGNIVVDIGGGTSDIAVLSLGEVVISDSIKMAGDKFDESIVKYIKKAYNILIGERTAENIKQEIGCVYKESDVKRMTIKGRCLLTGLPKSIEINSAEIMQPLQECAISIVDAIHGVLEKTPPELVGDIYQNGIVMTGGGALIRGFDKLIESRIGIKTYVADDAVSCVAIGTGKSLDYIDRQESSDSSIFHKSKKRF